MKRMREVTIVFAVALPIFGCSNADRVSIREVIHPISLQAGKRDTLLVSDLFYAAEYPLRFEPHEQITIGYDSATRTLVLHPSPSFEGFTTLAFELGGEVYAIPVICRIREKHTFRYRPGHQPDFRMNIMGTFNDWNRNSLPMQDPDGDGTYEIELELDPGHYLYQFVIDKKETFDPENPQKVDNGFGGFNSMVQIPPRHSNRAYLHILTHEQSGEATTLKFFYQNENQLQDLRPENVIVLVDNKTVARDDVVVYGNDIAVRLASNELAGEKVVRVAVTQNGQASNLQIVRLIDGRPMDSEPQFSNWHDAIIYSLMIDRFHDGDETNSQPVDHDSLLDKVNYFGGDLQGILDKLEAGYFDSLGINTLWLSPVIDNTNEAFREWPKPHRYYSGYHGYWPTHPERVEERFGDMALLRVLVARAHAHGIKVLLDFVAHHVHQEHPFFINHRDWFGTYELPDGRKNIRLWDEFRLTTWFEPFLPAFDYLGSKEALEVMSDNAVWWLEQTNVDGFRHDAVKHLPNNFWRTLTRKIKREIERPQNRKIFQVGETFGSYGLISSYVNHGQLDAQFNFNLHDAALYVFLTPGADFDMLAQEMQKTFSVYGVDHLMGNIMDSHDKVRYMAYADGDIPLNSSDAKEIGWTTPPAVDHESSYDKTRLHLTYLLTIPGVPILYYGDEIGMTGSADPDNRRMMRYGQQLTGREKRMLADVRALISVRRRHSALRYGDFQTLYADANCFVFLRCDPNERILVALNKSATPERLRIALPAVYGLSTAESLLSNDRMPITKDLLPLTLPPYGGMIWRLK
ncbi:MAG: alpha-amylase family glycosyl hydrolase [bacterium]